MKTFYLLILISSALLIQACSTTSSVSEEEPKARPPTPEYLNPEQLISKALNTSNLNLRSSFYLDAASLYWENNLLAQSNAALESVSPEELNHSQLQQYLIISLKLGIKTENIPLIKQTLPLLSTLALQKTDIEQQIEFVNLITYANKLTGNHIQAAVLLIENFGLFDYDDSLTILEEIWSSLRSADIATLGQFQYSGENQDAIAWLDLARLIQQNQINLEEQYNALSKWNLMWPYHPAAITPPKELLILKGLPQTRPTSITLALPLTGPISGAGKAIREGFMANYYKHLNAIQPTSNSADKNTFEVYFFDTHTQNIKDLYLIEQAENSLIIGPLDKQSLNSLSELDQLHTKTLALNYLDKSKTAQANLFQFGLAPETETRQLAQHLVNKKLTKIGVIAPESNWGFRIHDAFQEAITQENGLLIESAFYQDQASLSSTVATLLGTDKSKLRKRKIRSITQSNFEFLPRRREDIDAIFMIAKPEIAKQLKPLFSYHYASDIPVFSTSQVHRQQDESNSDLDNIEFIEIPWMLSNTIDIKNELRKTIPGSQEKYSRFYALGVDAFKLAPRLKLLREIKDSQIQGQTGTLSMNSKGIISREMEWAKFKRGKAVSVPK